MKIQDIVFLIVFAGLIVYKKPQYFVIAGLSCLMLAIPFFAKWIFFTAERLTWYAGAYLLYAILINIFSKRRSL